MDSTSPIIEVKDLRRTYVTKQGVIQTNRIEQEALKGVSFEVERGELFGLLGPNGAGKTTLTKILSTILLPTGGTARIDTFDLVSQTDEVRRRIGVVLGGERGLYYRLTARENLQYWAALYELDVETERRRIPYLLDLVGLAERADDRVENFSRGMKQRLHLARGLIARPRLLFLDEPSAGLDPIAAIKLRAIIQQLQREGVTIFLTTHLMKEAEALCDRVAFINEGQIVLIDRPRALTKLAEDLRVIEIGFDAGQPVPQERLSAIPGVKKVDLVGDNGVDAARLHLETRQPFATFLQALANLDIKSVNNREPSLEEVYVRIVGDRGMKV